MFVIQFIGSLLGMLLVFVQVAAIFALPGLFVSSVYRYVQAKRANKKAPGTYSDLEMKKRKLLLIVFSVLFGVCVAVFVGLVIILAYGIAYM